MKWAVADVIDRRLGNPGITAVLCEGERVTHINEESWEHLGSKAPHMHMNTAFAKAYIAAEILPRSEKRCFWCEASVVQRLRFDEPDFRSPFGRKQEIRGKRDVFIMCPLQDWGEDVDAVLEVGSAAEATKGIWSQLKGNEIFRSLLDQASRDSGPEQSGNSV